MPTRPPFPIGRDDESYCIYRGARKTKKDDSGKVPGRKHPMCMLVASVNPLNLSFPICKNGSKDTSFQGWLTITNYFLPLS